jgi:hypothetical protein
MPRQPLVDERVVCRQQIDDTMILPQLAAEKELGLSLERVT